MCIDSSEYNGSSNGCHGTRNITSKHHMNGLMRMKFLAFTGESAILAHVNHVMSTSQYGHTETETIWLVKIASRIPTVEVVAYTFRMSDGFSLVEN